MPLGWTSKKTNQWVHQPSFDVLWSPANFGAGRIWDNRLDALQMGRLTPTWNIKRLCFQYGGVPDIGVYPQSSSILVGFFYQTPIHFGVPPWLWKPPYHQPLSLPSCYAPASCVSRPPMRLDSPHWASLLRRNFPNSRPMSSETAAMSTLVVKYSSSLMFLMNKKQKWSRASFLSHHISSDLAPFYHYACLFDKYPTQHHQFFSLLAFHPTSVTKFTSTGFTIITLGLEVVNVTKKKRGSNDPVHYSCWFTFVKK